jgi:hypothetical protein
VDQKSSHNGICNNEAQEIGSGNSLAREIMGTDANAEMQELARRIAEAQIDLHRVRHAGHQLISQALSDPDYGRPKCEAYAFDCAPDPPITTLLIPRPSR